MSGLRPRLVPTLITVPAVFVCLALGAWQVHRLHWKEGLIAQRAAALAAPAAAPPETAADARRREFHEIVTEGVLLNDRALFVHAIGPEGGLGFDLLAPLREEDGRIVFVDRGFVPAEQRDRVNRPEGVVRVAGRLRLPPAGKPGWFIPDNRPEQGEWFWIDLPAMARADHLAADGLTNIAPFYLAADPMPGPAGWPRGGARLPELPNHHLQYAITWFSLAAAAAIIYFLSQRAGGGEDK